LERDIVGRSLVSSERIDLDIKSMLGEFDRLLFDTRAIPPVSVYDVPQIAMELISRGEIR